MAYPNVAFAITVLLHQICSKSQYPVILVSPDGQDEVGRHNFIDANLVIDGCNINQDIN